MCQYHQELNSKDKLQCVNKLLPGAASSLGRTGLPGAVAGRGGPEAAREGPLLGGLEGGPVVGPLLGGLEAGPEVGPLSGLPEGPAGALPKEKTALVGLAVDPGLPAEDPGLLAVDPGLLAGLGGGMSSPGGLEGEGEGLLLGRREEEPSAWAPPPLLSSEQN
jgi:hypothetical protein